jgi:hypothetical protein
MERVKDTALRLAGKPLKQATVNRLDKNVKVLLQARRANRQSP